jgi:polyisoprenoid-binding protein YceI
MQITSKVFDVDEDPFAVPAAPAIYEIDPAHASARFTVRHLMVSSVHGQLGRVTGRLELDLDDVKLSSVEASIDVTAINTQHADRDAHLRSAEFLDAAHHPLITFRSTRIDECGGSQLLAIGDLTIRGTTRQVEMVVDLTDDVRDPWGKTRRGVVATTRINRKDFGVSFHAVMDAGGLVVGDIVEIFIDLEVVRTHS